jgi:uncharacterized protein (DUF2062 family)
MNPRRWLHEHSLKLLAIRDTPNAIAGGVAIGIFFGFTPLFGLKTICAILFAWLTRSNIIAAVLGGALHDLILPVMPVVFLWEYKMGYWLLHQEWPAHFSRADWPRHGWRDWTAFLTEKGKPWLLGSALCGAPVAAACFLITRTIVARHQKKKQAQLQKAADI